MENTDQSLNEVILLDKPEGISSFGCVAKVRGHYRAKLGVKKIKVGHSGTLDPFATGLLIILVGKATKKQDEYMHKDKVYEAVMELGKTSTTGDPEGDIIEVSSSHISQEEFEKVLPKFIGKIRQTPPIFSAIKIGGRRAYDLARKGQAPKMPERDVEIYSMELLEFNFPIAKIRAHVSSGTYIRTLVEDIGRELRTGAYTRELRRTKIGEYSVDDAESLQFYEAGAKI
jgi:tRNA pseudouridine55 synthase